MASRYLSYTDRTGEIAFAVIMVIIINGYVALTDLNSGFTYIIVVNLGACASWGLIDGLIYAFSGSIERNNMRNKLLKLKASLRNGCTIEVVKATLNDTYLSTFDDAGKEAIAKEIVVHVSGADFGKVKVLTKNEIMGWLAIIGIYMTVGVLLALPFLILSDKVLAWILSNICGVTWLTWYGIQMGKTAGKNRWLLGAFMAIVSILFILFSYLAWAK
ncbi:MAG: hypothetical protein NWE92_11385 [Candidatus Bathyarchaeota archaeon]|nr:hypothetical protein [Candidatus Bathyarchaeota archaeon]